MVQERNNVELSRAAVACRALVGRAVIGRRERYVLSLAFVDACQTIAQIAKLRRVGRPCILTKLDRPFERRRSLVESMLIDIEIRKRGEIARRLYPIRLGIDDQMLIHRECALSLRACGSLCRSASIRPGCGGAQ